MVSEAKSFDEAVKWVVPYALNGKGNPLIEWVTPWKFQDRINGAGELGGSEWVWII